MYIVRPMGDHVRRMANAHIARGASNINASPDKREEENRGDGDIGEVRGGREGFIVGRSRGWGLKE